MFAPWVRNLNCEIVKSLPSPTLAPTGGVGIDNDRCIMLFLIFRHLSCLNRSIEYFTLLRSQTIISMSAITVLQLLLTTMIISMSAITVLYLFLQRSQNSYASASHMPPMQRTTILVYSWVPFCQLDVQFRVYSTFYCTRFCRTLTDGWQLAELRLKCCLYSTEQYGLHYILSYYSVLYQLYLTPNSLSCQPSCKAPYNTD